MRSALLSGLGSAIIGAILALLIMFALIAAKTHTPSANPADQSALVYGQ